MQSLKTSNYISFYTANSADFYLFNLARFKPVRLQGSAEEARMLFNRLKQNNLSGFEKEAIDLFKDHFILVPNKGKETKPEKMKLSWSSKQKKETFTIRFATKINDKKAVWRSIKLIEKLFKQDQGKYKYLNVKFICNSLLRTSLYNLLLPFMKHIHLNFPFEEGNITFYVDVPLSYMAKHAEKLRLFIVPNMKFNIYINDKLQNEYMDAFEDMIRRWGFMLNFVFRLQRSDIEAIPTALRTLKSRFGAEFNYTLEIPIYVPSDNPSTYSITLPTFEQLDNLLEFILDDEAPYLNQNTLYSLLKKNLISYPNCSSCKACVSQSLYINCDGQIGRCFMECFRDPLKLLQSDIETIMDLCSGEKELSKEAMICKSCSLRYLCSGECRLISNNLQRVHYDQQAFRLRCQLRKVFMHGFLLDMTKPQNSESKKEVTYKWKAVNGKLDVITV